MGEGLSSLKAMGIDVDAVRNESQNSLSVQFVTLSSVVGEEEISTYSLAYRA